MDDLISILRDMAAGRRNKVGDFWGIHYCAEAAAALEAAREDAERYRWLRMRIAGREHVEDEFRYEHQDGEELAQEVDAAIDAARDARDG